MRCPKPILVKDKYGYVRAVACGQCIACRLNKAREWSIRIMNESQYHKKSCFLTLTYKDDNLPANFSISKRELQLFLKRIRKKIPFPIRYFASGEYGDQSKRPHYHLIIFGIGADDDVFKNRHYVPKAKGYQCEMDAWQYGMCFVGDVTYDSACYVAKYTMKKVRGKGAEEHYKKLGINPEFCLMSTRPGIGAKYLRDNHNRLMKRQFVVGKDGIKYGLPRYYKDRLFNSMFLSLKGAKGMSEYLDDLRRRALQQNKSPGQLSAEDDKARENMMLSLYSMKGERYEI